MLRQVNASELDKMNQSISNQLTGAGKLLQAEQALGQERQNLQAMADRLLRVQRDQAAGLITMTQEEKERVKTQEDFVSASRKELDIRQQQLTFLHSQLDVTKAIAGSMLNVLNAGKLAMVGVFMAMPLLLIQADQELRNVAVSSGMGANNMARMRDSLMEGALGAARLGASTKDLLHAQQAYMDVTGRLQILSAENLSNITAMAEGTNLGYEGAAKFAAAFGQIGMSVSDTKKYTEGVVNDTERMGLNSGKVLTNITQMVDKAMGYSFQEGMGKGLETMAQQAEKLKISISGAFAAADKARTLEGSLSMASQLMVLGGNFAKTDPFKLSFLARNDPAKFQAALADMTKGMATFNSQTGAVEIGAYNMDRLRAAAEATGAPLDNLIKSSMRAAEISKMSSQLFVGTQEQRDTIMAMATLGKNGRATISIESKDIDLAKLTSAQAGLLMSEKLNLEERAKQAMGFDKQLGIFTQELKATALPLLELLNKGMKLFSGVLDGLGPTGIKWIAGLSVGALALSKAFSVGQALMYLGTGKSAGAGLFETIASKIRGNGGLAPTIPPVAPVSAPGANPLGGGVGGGTSFTSAATLAAVGVAAIGIGYGFKLAAEGAGAFATSLQGLNPAQLDAMQGGLMRLGLGIGGIVLVAAGLAATGVGPVAVGVLLGIGAGVAAIGFGVKLATDGMANMMTSIAALGSVDLSRLGGFFSTVTGFMQGDTANLGKLQEAVEGLSRTTQSTMVDELKKLWETPLKIEAKDLDFVANIEVNTILDGEKFTNKYASRFAAKIMQAAKGAGSL